jgi:hypothetical protein
MFWCCDLLFTYQLYNKLSLLLALGVINFILISINNDYDYIIIRNYSLKMETNFMML